MDDMLVGLLEVSRVGRQGDPMAPQPMRPMLDEALSYLTLMIEDRGARVEVRGDWPVVVISRNEGVRLFQNLIGNALKYCPADRTPQVVIGVEPTTDGWCFTIADNGIGIDPTQIDRLFKVFQRLHTHDAFEGTGIGLAVCRRIVERCGGRIRIDSEGPDRGATVTFVLPAAPDGADEPGPVLDLTPTTNDPHHQ
jgi:light-regulated signal transduction histidine kinase (bacteriophytochrome)